jgi:hypothetical protein
LASDDTIVPVKKIFQPIHGRALRKVLWKRLHLPRALVHGGLSIAKTAANPAQVRLRRRYANEIGALSGKIGPIPKDKAFRVFGPGALPESDAIVRQCRELCLEKRASARIDESHFNPRKHFLLSLLRGDEFLAYPELIRFMVSRPILDVVSEYLGAVPLLAGAALWWSPKNDTAHRSQLYHYDGEDASQVKVVFNLFDTEPEHGPFTLLPADQCEPFRAALASRERVTDEKVEAQIGKGKAIQLVGPAGSGAFVDTSRCLHYGSRGNREDRFVLIFQFLRFECPTESTFRFGATLDLGNFDADPVQKLALGVR